jgi:hypothetical protein
MTIVSPVYAASGIATSCSRALDRGDTSGS